MNLHSDVTEPPVAPTKNGFKVGADRRRDGFLYNVKRGKAAFLIKAELQNTDFGSLPISLSTQILACRFLIFILKKIEGQSFDILTGTGFPVFERRNICVL